MALSAVNLKSNFVNIFGLNAQKSYPSDTDAAAAMWAIALDEYAALVTPLSKTSEPARAALELELKGAFRDRVRGSQLMKTAFGNYAAALGAGMAPEFVAKPPLNFPIEAIAELGRAHRLTREQAMDIWGEAIDTWFRTGTATNSASGATVPWT